MRPDSAQAVSATEQEASSLSDEPATTMRALVKVRDEPGLDLDPVRPLPTGSTGRVGEPGPDEVLLRVLLAGVCGTDRHIWEWDQWSRRRIPLGVVTGHEFVGVVEKVGAAVRGLAPGDRVAAEGHIVRSQDLASRTGDAHVARDMVVIGVDRDGCFADYIMMPAANIWPLPEAIPDRHAAIMDPLGNAVHTVMSAGVSGRTVLVSGVGTIGLMAVAVAKALGAHAIFAVDVDERKLNLARELGAEETFDARDIDPAGGPGGWVEQLRRRTGGDGVDVLLEMSGFEAALDAGFRALRNGGVAALLGTPAEPVRFDLAEHVIFKGARVVGVTGRRLWETWVHMERLLLAGAIPLDRIITHTLPLERYAEAFALMQRGEAIKVLFDVAGSRSAS